MKSVIAELSNKRLDAGRGIYICDWTCGHCGNVRPIGFGYWSGLVCMECNVENYRNERHRQEVLKHRPESEDIKDTRSVS